MGENKIIGPVDPELKAKIDKWQDNYEFCMTHNLPEMAISCLRLKEDLAKRI